MAAFRFKGFVLAAADDDELDAAAVVSGPSSLDLPQASCPVFSGWRGLPSKRLPRLGEMGQHHVGLSADLPWSGL